MPPSSGGNEEPGWPLPSCLCKVLRMLSGQPGWVWRDGQPVLGSLEQELLRSGSRSGEPIPCQLLGPGPEGARRRTEGACDLLCGMFPP